MIEWIWQQVGLCIPAEWECLQFSRDPEQGRCAFADRRRYRFEWNWRRFKQEPDFERMLKDYASSLKDDWEGIKTVRVRTWPGLMGRRGDECVTRFGQYFAATGLLVELVFIHPGERDEGLEASVLKTVRDVPPDPAGFQRWRAFGLDMRVPAEFTLTESVVEPARIGFRFDGPHKPDRWIFRRYGMVDAWLKQPVREWLDGQADVEVRERARHTGQRGRMHVARLDGAWRPRGLLVPRGAYAAAAWQDPGDRRLYHAICITSRKSQEKHPRKGADEYLTSCPEFLAVP